MTQLVPYQRFISTTATSYEDAIRALNTLQSNAAYLQSATSNHSSGSASLNTMTKYLLRSGLTLEDVDRLSVIHVAGTKGKGSTCAFTEAILRNYGFRTGFYSSPHLIHVAERIRINGRPITEALFTKYFWRVYNELSSKKENDSDMPTYFKFLTVLMFHIFLNSDIDVVILEVGIGGEYDCTNVVRRPVCVGITSLGLEHTALLGNTLEAIAFQKSGIFKANAIAFTVPQPENAMNVIEQRAIERNCRLRIVPDFKSYNWIGGPPVLGIATNVQKGNASLAIQLAHTWMTETAKANSNLASNKTMNDPQINIKRNDRRIKPSCVECGKNDNAIEVDNGTTTIVSRSRDNGNNDVRQIRYGDKSVYTESLSDAFSPNMKELRENNDSSVERKSYTISFTKTASALSSCTWPGRAQILRGSNMDFYLDGAHTYESIEVCASWYLGKVGNGVRNRFLIFNITGGRDVSKLFKPLKRLDFNKVYFVPNVSGKILKLDQLELKTTNCERQDRCWKNLDIWGEENAVVLNSVSEALAHINEESNSMTNSECERKRPQVLITGSLHLIGAALLLLDPKLTMKTDY